MALGFERQGGIEKYYPCNDRGQSDDVVEQAL
jgi:hypothetical protein